MLEQDDITPEHNSLSVRAELVEVRDKQPVLRQAQHERFLLYSNVIPL
jgi:hypothetical protein